MKFKKLLWVLISILLCFSSTVHAVEIYNRNLNLLKLSGKLDNIRYVSCDKRKDGNRSVISYGFKGKTKLNNQYSSYGFWEYELSIINKNFFHAVKTADLSCSGTIGLQCNNFGILNYGKNYNILSDIGLWTGSTTELGKDLISIDNHLVAKLDDLLTYRNKNFFGKIKGLDIALQCRRQNINRDYSQIVLGDDGGYGASIIYAINDKLSTGLVLSRNKRGLLLTQDNNNIKSNMDVNRLLYKYGKKSNGYGIGVKYVPQENCYFSTLYSQISNFVPYGNFSKISDNNFYGISKKSRNFEFLLKQRFKCGLQPIIGYIDSQIDIDHGIKNKIFKRYVDIGTTYYFSDHITSSVNYRINLVPNDIFTRKANILKGNVFSLGVTYFF